MDKSQLALKLLLDDLGLRPSIRTVRDRKTVQKGVYLAQAAGVDLGYRYNWYRMGPYSPGLTRDYFALDEALSTGDDESEGFELQDSVRARLEKIRPLLSVPKETELALAEWLELIASVHYLMVRRRMNRSQATEQLRVEKPHLVSYADMAVETLEDRGLLVAA